MPRFATATVTEILVERAGLQRVDTDAGRAYVLTGLIGPVAVGDRVVLNTTAVDLGLGTGGWHVVHWNLARDGWSQPGPGHIMKLRYTSLQVDTGAAEETRPDLPEALDGLPVVACSLHSQVAVVAAVVRHLRPTARIAYVMTDGAALPLARHVASADIAIVGVGPGVVGTASSLGTTAVEVAAIADAAAALGGRVAVCCRVSSADSRERHRGISHHVHTALRLTCHRPEVPLPTGLAAVVDGAEPIDGPDAATVLAALGLDVTTMGRGPAEDPDFFAAAASAGAWAAAALVPRAPA